MEMELTSEAIEVIDEMVDSINSLVFETFESGELCLAVSERLERLWSELQQLQDLKTLHRHRLVLRMRDVVARFVGFLGLHSGISLLLRLAACRSVAERTKEFHEEIDAVSQDLGLEGVAEWRTQWEAHVRALLKQVGELVDNGYQDVGKGLSCDQLVEALSCIKFEVERKRESNPPEHLTRLEHTLELVRTSEGVELPALPSWFVPSYAVAHADVFDFGSFSEVARGTWDGRRVVVKRMFEIDDETKKTFAKETQLWAPLEHENVIKLFGACHVSDPLFFVCEDATKGNFQVHFRDAGSKKRGLWRLFLQAAQGLSYLHERNIVHGDLKCNNLLIGADGMAKISGFGYSYIRISSVGLTLQPVTPTIVWKAPECLRGMGSAARPRHESDVYSLGMSIIEAMTGDVPWGVVSEDYIIEKLMESEGYPRPEGVFADREWELVQGMTQYDPEKRWSLDRAIEMLTAFADDEVALDAATKFHSDLSYFRYDGSMTTRGETLIQCIIERDPESSWLYRLITDEVSRLIEEESSALAKEAAAAGVASAEELPSATAAEDRLKLLADHFKHHAPSLSNEDRDRCLHQIQQVRGWLSREIGWQVDQHEFRRLKARRVCM